MLDVVREVSRARERVSGLVRETPLEHSPRFSGGGYEAYLKLENIQHTGSFKVRGASNKLLSLSDEERGRGVVAASSGNHGAAVAFAARRLGVRCEVFVPEGASETKVGAIHRLGARLERRGSDAAETEDHARRYAAERGLAYISPYNDPEVIGGQGTIAAEMIVQSGGLDAVYVPVGGGGLISGVAGYLKELYDGVRIIGCQPERSAVMAASVRAGRILELESGPTLSDGTAGGVESGAATFELCRRYVDEWALVSEEEIAAAMRSFIEVHHMLAEGAAGVALAALSRASEEGREERAAAVICGANVSPGTLSSVL